MREDEAQPRTSNWGPKEYEWAREQAERYDETAGTEAAELRGRPIVVFTNRGAKSGRLYKTAVMRVEHDGVYAAVASKGGAPENPKWYANLKAHPRVELRDGAVKREYIAREVSGMERDEWWARAVEAWPDYAEYQKKTDRTIPVFVFEPVPAGSADED